MSTSSTFAWPFSAGATLTDFSAGAAGAGAPKEKGAAGALPGSLAGLVEEVPKEKGEEVLAAGALGAGAPNENGVVGLAGSPDAGFGAEAPNEKGVAGLVVSLEVVVDLAGGAPKVNGVEVFEVVLEVSADDDAAGAPKAKAAGALEGSLEAVAAGLPKVKPPEEG